jgi:hypothetical protein
VARVRAGSRGQPAGPECSGASREVWAKPPRRTYIPRPDGRQRPLGIAALEEEILQRALVEVVNAIYEQGLPRVLVWVSAGALAVSRVRFADDAVVGFEHRADAERFRAELRDRLARFGLELNAEKTRLIEFGRFAASSRKRRGLGKPGDVPIPGFHAPVREDQEGPFAGQADHRLKAAAREAALGQGRADATPPPADPRAGRMARQRPARARQLRRTSFRGSRWPCRLRSGISRGSA